MAGEDKRYCLEQAGFTDDQIDALYEVFATHPHSHDMGDIIGLEDELEELAELETSDVDEDE
jgi:hypothetical protein